MKIRDLNILYEFLKRNGIISEEINVLKSMGDEYMCLEWYSNNERNRTYEEDLIINGYGTLSAFIVESKLKDEHKNFIKIIKENRIEFECELKCYHSDCDRIGNLYLNNHENCLVCIYKNADIMCLISIDENNNKRILNIHGELIERNLNIVAIERYTKRNSNRPIELYDLPSLNLIDEITRQEAILRNLVPTNNKPKNYLKNK